MAAWVRPPVDTIARVVSLLATLVVAAGIAINYLNLSDDPYRCKALLHDGTWLDQPDENGDRDPFEHWQPQGCMMHEYDNDDIKDCMEGRHMVFFGDSTTRQIFWAMGRLVSESGFVVVSG